MLFPEEANNSFIRVICSALTVAQVLCCSRLIYLFLLSQASESQKSEIPVCSYFQLWGQDLVVEQVLWAQGCGAMVVGLPQLLGAMEWFLAAGVW